MSKRTGTRAGSYVCGAVLCLATSLAPDSVQAHGSGGRLGRLSATIAEHPNNAELYLRRAKLQLKQGATQAALEDLKRAAELAPERVEVELLRAKALLSAGDLEEALNATQTYRSRGGDQPEVSQVAGSALLKLARFREAEAEFQAYVEAVKKPTPEDFLSYADAIVQQGAEHIERALVWLNRGTRRVGRQAPELHLRVVELTLQKGDTYGALARVDERLKDTKKSKVPWWAKRGDVLTRMGRNAEARTAYQKCLASIRSLGVKGRKEWGELDQEIQGKLAALP